MSFRDARVCRGWSALVANVVRNMCAPGGEGVMMVPVTMDEVERRMIDPVALCGRQVEEVLARLGSPASDVDGRRLEREVHGLVAISRTDSCRAELHPGESRRS